ncbi:hypothetical protein P153DRAFT_388610 [Dothidotthia symphoricarpi CBS 119687]|uniref:C2H2-type domain-containing protein n=1 Tax=Dothidotthia symphoricarpi CBS 119687 TaxID=1392245 RepID=A0A6A6A674_9PLEO|nr:uncharacterized protein P153DRAFT_388610 [Dothidotthia symphoricarpi CBS 119687]KAF2126574.1 hypothetical protein P153DRAFT_388610 [Dothidotthia symphoricarpi CBS 119687]
MSDTTLPDLLLSALNSASEKRIRATLEKICAQVPDALDVASDELLVTSADLKAANERAKEATKEAAKKGTEASHAISLDEDENAAKEPVEKGKEARPLKRKREDYVAHRFEPCIDCEQEFDALTNGPTSCLVHTKTLKIDTKSPAWWDYDQRFHGKKDTPANREKHPDGFRWGCCKRFAGRPGCQIGLHRVKGAARKKTAVLGLKPDAARESVINGSRRLPEGQGVFDFATGTWRTKMTA